MHESIVKLGDGVMIPKSVADTRLSKRQQLEKELTELCTEEVRFEFPLEWEERYHQEYQGYGAFVCVEIMKPLGLAGFFIHTSISNCEKVKVIFPLRPSQIDALFLSALERSVEILRSSQKKD